MKNTQYDYLLERIHELDEKIEQVNGHPSFYTPTSLRKLANMVEGQLEVEMKGCKKKQTFHPLGFVYKERPKMGVGDAVMLILDHLGLELGKTPPQENVLKESKGLK